MISIVNVSTHDDLIGINEYEVRINSNVITKFKHVRRDGLAVCLEKSAQAVREKDKKFIMEVLNGA